MVDTLINRLHLSRPADWLIAGILAGLLVLSLVMLILAHRHRTKTTKLKVVIDRYNAVHQACDDYMDVMVGYLPLVTSSMAASLEHVQSMRLANSHYLGRVLDIMQSLKKLALSVEQDNQNSEIRSDTKTQILFGSKPNPIKSVFAWSILAVSLVGLCILNRLFKTSLPIFTQAEWYVAGLLLFILSYQHYGQAVSLKQRSERYASLIVTLFNARREFIHDTAQDMLDQHLRLMQDSTELSSIPQARGFFNGLVLLAKLGNSTLSVHRASDVDDNAPLFAVSVFLDKLVERKYAAAAKAHQLQLNVAVDPGLTYYVHPKDFEQLIDTIMANAINYCQPGARIFLRGKRRGDKILISVTDTGAGIAKDQLDYLFSPHRRDDPDSPTVKISLGLHVSKVIVCRFGGELKVASKLGKGTVATIIAPRKRTQLKLDIPRHVTTTSGRIS